MRRLTGVLLLIVTALLFLSDRFSVSRAETPFRYDAESLYARANEAVFYVRAFREDGTVKDVGTGFVISPGGMALTAYHVIEEADRLSCVLQNGKTVSCSVTAQEKTADTAVLQLPAQTGEAAQYAFLPLRTSPLKAGEKVFAIGYPMKETKMITEGIVNAPAAPINGRDRILLSAQLVNGMSGGPVLDQYGYAAGLASGSLRTMNGIHLAVDTAELYGVMKLSESDG